MNFAQHLRAQMPRDLFGEQDVKLAQPALTPNAIRKGVSRSLANQELVALKRGLYTFGPRLRKHPLSEFSIANQLYGPSYVSFESALSFHRLIPEAVYTVTSACFLRKKKKFSTPLGEFSYDFIPCRPFFMGVEYATHSPHHFQVANPIKALFDYVYLRKKRYESFDQIESDLRIDADDLREAAERFSKNEIEVLAASYRKPSLNLLLQLLTEGRT